jgi:hypothetical protein
MTTPKFELESYQANRRGMVMVTAWPDAQQLVTNTWVQATWEEFLALIESLSTLAPNQLQP